MDKILVAGASGQTGSAVVRKLMAGGHRVRAMVRSSEAEARLRRQGAETIHADLTRPETLDSACQGIMAIVATANSAIRSNAADTFAAVERHGYSHLIRAAVAAGVKRFVYTSVPRTRVVRSPFMDFKRETEERLLASGMDCIIFRAGVFMDVAFAMMGSGIPVHGAEGATVTRPFRLSSARFRQIKDSIEQRRIAYVPGDGRTRHSFICIDDVAGFLVSAVSNGRPGIYDIGGPQALTFLDVVRIYENLLGSSLAVRKTPAAIFHLLARCMQPFSEAAANLMWLNYIAAVEDSAVDAQQAADIFQISLTSADSFLRSKQALTVAEPPGVVRSV